MNLKQFKLTNNDEIVAEILEIVEEGDLVLRNALKIFHAEDFDNGVRYYSFKPWMSFQDNVSEVTVLNVGHIIGETSPSAALLLHYTEAMNQIKKMEKKKEFNIDEIVTEVANLNNDEMREYLKMKLEKMDNEDMWDDSEEETDNVIQFTPPGTKLH
tara:strand:- start:932 stop:1402 length:471 start_codon:yes stop_codon:yes gene_type:complete